MENIPTILPREKEIAKDRADWLLDAIAMATQDHRLLRGEPDANQVLIDAILMNGEKAILTAFLMQQREP